MLKVSYSYRTFLPSVWRELSKFFPNCSHPALGRGPGRPTPIMLRMKALVSALLLSCACLSGAERRAHESFLQRMARSYSQAMDTPGLLPRDSHSTVVHLYSHSPFCFAFLHQAENRLLSSMSGLSLLPSVRGAVCDPLGS